MHYEFSEVRRRSFFNEPDRNVKVGIGLAAVSACSASLGYLGGRTLQIAIHSVSPLGHGLTLGLTPLIALGLYTLLDSLDPKQQARFFEDSKAHQLFSSAAFKGFVSIGGGYLVSLAITNLAGMQVGILGPFIGLNALIGAAALVVLVTAPVIICFSLGLYGMMHTIKN